MSSALAKYRKIMHLFRDMSSKFLTSLATWRSGSGIDSCATRRMVRVSVLAMLLVVAAPSQPSAHEIPVDVTVTAFVKPEPGRLLFLVRVPLESMRDFDFPTTEAGYLDIRASESMFWDSAVLWIADYVEFFENGTSLGAPRVTAVRASLPSDRSFRTFQSAWAHMSETPIPEGVQIPIRQVLLDVLLEFDIDSPESDFSFRSGLNHLGETTMTVLQFLPSAGGRRVLQYTGNPGLVTLDPRWHQVMFRFVKTGFIHILEGFDHLLFLFCLVIPVRRFWSLVPIVTSFTVAHSITLVASALGLAPRALWFPPLIESLIALSIVAMALENIVGGKLKRRWMVAFGFGLVHGFGFSFALSESLQFAGSHFVASLFSFNVGVEIGQLAAISVMVPCLVFFARRVKNERALVIVLSALILHTSWHWMTERAVQTLAHDIHLPTVGWALMASAMRWMTVALIAFGGVWLLKVLFAKFPGVGNDTSVPGATEQTSGS